MDKKALDENPVLKLAVEFSVSAISFSTILRKNGHDIISRQFLKSGTSIGANIIEAQNSESPKDFVHKFKLAAKEADESQYWLIICRESEDCPSPPENIFSNIDSLNRMIGKIISTTKKKYNL